MKSSVLYKAGERHAWALEFSWTLEVLALLLVVKEHHWNSPEKRKLHSQVPVELMNRLYLHALRARKWKYSLTMKILFFDSLHKLNDQLSGWMLLFSGLLQTHPVVHMESCSPVEMNLCVCVCVFMCDNYRTVVCSITSSPCDLCAVWCHWAVNAQ